MAVWWKFGTHFLQEMLQHPGDVVGGVLGELHQAPAVLKRLAQLLHPGFGPAYPIDPLCWGKGKRSGAWAGARTDRRKGDDAETKHPSEQLTCTPRARASISEVHFTTMKGTSSGKSRGTWVKSMPKRGTRLGSFLWPQVISRLSRHFLWQAR